MTHPVYNLFSFFNHHFYIEFVWQNIQKVDAFLFCGKYIKMFDITCQKNIAKFVKIIYTKWKLIARFVQHETN